MITLNLNARMRGEFKTRKKESKERKKKEWDVFFFWLILHELTKNDSKNERKNDLNIISTTNTHTHTHIQG